MSILKKKIFLWYMKILGEKRVIHSINLIKNLDVYSYKCLDFEIEKYKKEFYSYWNSLKLDAILSPGYYLFYFI